MKKIKYLIFVLALFLFTASSVHASTCTYTDGQLTATVTIDSKSNASAKIKGYLNSTDETDISITDDVDNWGKIFNPKLGPSPKIKFNAKSYYELHKECPEYAIFADIPWGEGGTWEFKFALFSEQFKAEFEKYGKKTQGYAIMEIVGGTDPQPSFEPHSCIDFPINVCTNGSCEKSCEHNSKFSCIWNETDQGSYCNTDNLLYISCADAFDMPHQIPQILSFIFNLLKIGTPIILIIVSIISLVKALAASKDDEIKKAQHSLIRKLIAGALVFFIASIVQLVISIVADSSETENVSTCIDCLLNNDCESSMYYKTNVGGTTVCTYLESGEEKTCDDN